MAQRGVGSHYLRVRNRDKRRMITTERAFCRVEVTLRLRSRIVLRVTRVGHQRRYEMKLEKRLSRVSLQREPAAVRTARENKYLNYRDLNK